jgi:hypothetical protein
MNLESLLQFLLSLFSKVSIDNPEQNQTPEQPQEKPTLNTITVIRGPEKSSGIYGTGSLSWDPFIFEVLENDEFEVPKGTYRLEWHQSPHLHETVPELVDVKGRTDILMHEGNVERASKGCLLVGSCRDGNAIDNSKTTLATLKEKINAVGIETCQIIIS